MSLFYKVAGSLLGFISAPLALDCLGESKYGIYISVLSIISWIYYFDLGVGNGLRNRLAANLANDEYDKAKKLLDTNKLVQISKKNLMKFSSTIYKNYL